MKKISILFVLCFTAWSFGQEKTTFKSTDGLVSAIQSDFASTWKIIKSDGEKEETLKKANNLAHHEKQTEGFKLNPSDAVFYYIAYKKGKSTQYITSLKALAKFIGRIDNPQEGALKAITEGYFVDMEYKNIAGSYSEDAENYYLDIGKIISQKCPFQKNSFLLIMNKGTGKIEKAKEMEKYQEVYLKDCENNPHRFIPPKKKKKKEVISIYG